MYLVELILPVSDNQGAQFPRSHFDRVRDELVERFGGVTAFLRSPAEGVWKESPRGQEAAAVRDDVVIFEVMADALDRSWWHRYRLDLTARFAQDELVVRATLIERL
jgi:hypothetical protein